ncbi:MAG: hypothetical protein H0V81_07850 [Solirubrobacterales bacterium]|nr:hypothetical protein [Solirubrobacterales bacterium]
MGAPARPLLIEEHVRGSPFSYATDLDALEGRAAAGPRPSRRRSRAVAELDALLGPVVFRALAWCVGMRGEHALGRRELSGSLAEALLRLTRTEAVVEAVTWAQAPRR